MSRVGAPRVCVVLLAVAVVVANSRLALAIDDSSIPDFDRFKLSVGPWVTSSMARWQTSFPLSPSIPKSQLAFGSTLEYNDPSLLIWMYSAEVRPWRRFSLELKYADSGQIGGVERDHDWLYGPDYIVTAEPSGNVYVSPKYTDMSLSQADLSGRTTFFEANAYARVFIFKADDRLDDMDFFPYQWVDVGMGYFTYDDRFRVKNLVQLVSTGDFIQTPPPGAYPGLDSTFHFHYQGFKLFALREATGIYHSLRAVGSFGWSPFVSYNGDGYWNLRTDFRPQAPSFIQWADGNMLEWRLGLAWDPFRFLSAQLGYQMIYSWIRPGTIQTFNADGSTTTQGLDSAWIERKGWDFSVALRF